MCISIASACRGSKSSSQSKFAGEESPQRVILHATELPSQRGGQRAWRVAFIDHGDTAAFDVILTVPSGVLSDTAFPVTNGVLRRVPGARGRLFLDSLSHAMLADSVPQSIAHVDSLLSDVGFLGTHLSHSKGRSMYAGEFTSDPSGDWIVTKLFLAEGEAEVFFALNARTGEAQLIAKDSDSANKIVEQFAQLF